MSDTREACPFCGKRNNQVKHSGRWGWFVSCQCAAVGPSAGSKQGAIDAWNRRVEPEQPSLFDDGKLVSAE